MQNNETIRRYCALRGVRLYELAAEMGIYESTLYRRLRNPLSEDERKRLLYLVERIADAHQAEADKEV